MYFKITSAQALPLGWKKPTVPNQYKLEKKAMRNQIFQT